MMCKIPDYYGALVQNSRLFMKFSYWVCIVWFLICAHFFFHFFSCFRLPMEMWKQRWYVSTEEETYQVHLLYWQTNMQVSLFVFRLLLHKIAKLGYNSGIAVRSVSIICKYPFPYSSSAKYVTYLAEYFLSLSLSLAHPLKLLKLNLVYNLVIMVGAGQKFSVRAE